jgi:hypothetical protein
MGTRNDRAVDGEAVGGDQPPAAPETASGRGSAAGGGVFIGKHRLAAAISCLEQEILSLQVLFLSPHRRYLS